MTERDDRRARLRELSDEFNWCNAKGRYAWLTKPVGERLSVDLRAELEASQRDRKALADARELLDMARYTSDDSGLVRQIDDYLKRTEPTDE